MFNPDEYWQLAKALIEQDAGAEAHHRTAASRAYYALFLTLRERLSGFEVRHNASDHGRVVVELRRRNRGPLADALASLRGLREAADYDLNVTVTMSQVTNVIRLAEIHYDNAKRLR
jgi:uncharacterized protein (UPF0332 family)